MVINTKEALPILDDLFVDDTHLKSSIAMINHAAELAGSGNAAVLGCGKCTEIPVHYLGRIFNRVDLVEMDIDALNTAEIRCRSFKDIKSHYIFHHDDLTGLISQIKPKAQEIARTATDPQLCLNELGKLITSTPPHFWSVSNDNKYSLIVCSGILTQLQSSVRKIVETIFLKRFPDYRSSLSSNEQWTKQIWKFARDLEDAFINYLKISSASGGIIYLSDTVHVSWLVQLNSHSVSTEGSWIATRTSQLADYLNREYVIVARHKWNWFRKQEEKSHWGRLYGVQAIIYRIK